MILSNPFDQSEFTGFVQNLLPDFKLDLRPLAIGSSGFAEVLRLGESQSLKTSVLVVRSKKNVNSRIFLTNNSFKILKAHQIYRALVVYVNDDETIWRLSLLTALPIFSDGKVIVSYSNPRRHSYVLGSDIGIATARKYLANMGKVRDFADLENRFSVETVNKDFYREVSRHFFNLVGERDEKLEYISKPLLKYPHDNELAIRNYAVRLLGRIVFLWFLKEKKSNDGVQLLPTELLDFPRFKHVLHNHLEPLFFEVLNEQMSSRLQTFSEGDYALVPYLNGGLFQPSMGASGDHYDPSGRGQRVEIDDEWFVGLFETLNVYNFTLDENLENDVDLSIDPEMLGRIFENLLAEISPETGKAARKTTGSYYTPRSIVNSMVDDSLTKYLEQESGIGLEKLSALVSLDRHDDLEHPLASEEKNQIISAIRKLTVIDPACGSGAFPMSILQKLVWILGQIDPTGDLYLDSFDYAGTSNWLSESRIDYLRKQKIIRDVIFGVDIQSVAVEIAKLRCFLTLIVDQEIDDRAPNRGVVPLPNLEFNFVCANTLVKLEEVDMLSMVSIEENLNSIRRKYFTANNPELKAKLQQEYVHITQPDLLDSFDVRTKQLKSFNPFDSNSVSEYFDANQMFGVSQGFNIVLGNPPYVDSELMMKRYATFRDYLRGAYVSTKGNWDLFVPFIEQSINLAATNGIVSLIVKNSLLGATYAKGIRDLMTKTDLLDLRDFGKVKVFESAAVDTCVFTLIKRKPTPDITYTKMLSLIEADYSVDILDSKLENSPSWVPHLVPKNFRSLLEKLGSHPRLSDSGLQGSAAATTSEAYEIAEFVVDNSNPDPAVKKLINTGTIDPFISLWGKRPTKYLGGVYEFPTISLSALEGISHRRTRQSQEVKIIVCGMGNIEAYLDRKGEFCPGKSTSIVYRNDDQLPIAPLEIAVGIMNSSLGKFWYRSNFAVAGMSGLNSENLMTLPLPRLALAAECDIRDLVLKCEANPSAENLKLLDDQIIQIFQLTPEEEALLTAEA